MKMESLKSPTNDYKLPIHLQMVHLSKMPVVHVLQDNYKAIPQIVGIKVDKNLKNVISRCTWIPLPQC